MALVATMLHDICTTRIQAPARETTMTVVGTRERVAPIWFL